MTGGAFSQTHSIRVPLVFAFVMAVLVPAIITNGFTALLGFRSSTVQAAEQLELVANFKTRQMTNWLEELADESTVFLDDVELVEQIGRVAGGSNIAEIVPLLRNLNETAKQSPRFDDLFILSLSDEIIVSTQYSVNQLGDALTENYALPNPYEGQINLTEAASRITFLPLQFVAETGKLELILTRPILNNDDQTVAILGSIANLDFLNTMMADRSGLGERGQLYLLSNRNQLLTQMADPESFPAVETLIDLPVSADTAISEYDNFLSQSVLGVTYDIPGADVRLVAELDQQEAYSAVNQTLAANVGLALLAGLVTVVIGILFVNRRIIRPLGQLARAAAELTAGDFNVQIPVETSDEYGVVAHSFNTMTSTVHSLIDSERQAKADLEIAVNRYVDFVQRVATGDLTSEIETDMLENTSEDLYILGSNLNGMVGGLRAMAEQIREVASTITYAAAEIQAVTVQQVSSITEQDAAVNETMATVEEVRETVAQTAARAQVVADASRQSVSVSRTGQDAVQDTIQGMTLIQDWVNSIADTILTLSERTQQIGEIINAVNGLADQSKLLALNASIEAARAGEEGRGFAVVAMEVRQLAEQSRDATSRVRAILNEIQSTTNEAVMVTEAGSIGAASGMGLVERAGDSIRDLAAMLEAALQAANQIAVSTHQQTNGMDQLAAAMAHIQQASAQAASSTEQTERSVQNIVAMAEQLEQAAARYQL